MDAGYDWLLIRSHLRRPIFGVPGLFLLLGALLLVGGGAYYGYAYQARSQLDELNVILSPSGIGDLALERRKLATTIASQQLFPGESLVATSWSNPLTYVPSFYAKQILLDGFMPIDLNTSLLLGSQIAPQRITIPEIRVDSDVTALQILEVGDSRAYETPKNTVGHIPESANPGEIGSSWFFGHLESPMMGVGAVFSHLPVIPSMLRNEDDVYIITDNGIRQFLYKVTSTKVVHENELELYDTLESTIHLVTCVPRLVYDHRLVVTGKLVGVKVGS
jgi:LPXTG-site transpeptidase (sortase) family protein